MGPQRRIEPNIDGTQIALTMRTDAHAIVGCAACPRVAPKWA